MQIENLSAQKALDEAQWKAQQALDATLPPEAVETGNQNGGAGE